MKLHHVLFTLSFVSALFAIAVYHHRFRREGKLTEQAVESLPAKRTTP